VGERTGSREQIMSGGAEWTRELRSDREYGADREWGVDRELGADREL
jgi:hypothetical protein